MGFGQDFLVGLIYLLSFVLVWFNPVSSTLGVGSLIGLMIIPVLGAAVVLAGISKISVKFFIPLLGFVFFDLRALGVFIFVIMGLLATRSQEKNMVVPKLPTLVKSAFSGYFWLILLSVVFIIPSIKFTVPTGVLGLASNLLVPAIGCDLEYTGQECIDVLVNKAIDSQCRENSACLELMRDQRDSIEESTYQQLASQIPGFSRDKTVKESVETALIAQINQMIAPYEKTFQIVMAVIIFSAFQFFALPFRLAASILSTILLKLFVSFNLIKKKTKKVDKVIFEA